MSIQTDVLICGSGSAGVCAAVWLARLGIDFRIIDKRAGPLRIGQADGVQCRTVEVFESFGLDQELKKDAYWVNEVVFWTACGDGNGIARTKRTADVLPGLSWQPHVILNQAKLNGLLLDEIRNCSGKEVDYGLAVREVRVDAALVDSPDAFPVSAVAENENGESTVYAAKYLLVGLGRESTAFAAKRSSVTGLRRCSQRRP
jgi:phenol 2-monooxygenase